MRAECRRILTGLPWLGIRVGGLLWAFGVTLGLAQAQWPGSGTLALGASLSSPGGPGATLDVAVIGPLALRGRWSGLWGTVTRGAGLGVDLLRAEVVRAYASGLVGEVRCIGDLDTPTCPNSPGASFAWYAGGGLEFEIAHPHKWTFGLEVGRWFSQTGTTLTFREQASQTVATALLRRYFGRGT